MAVPAAIIISARTQRSGFGKIHFPRLFLAFFHYSVKKPSTATSTTTNDPPAHVQVIGDTFGYPRTSYIFDLEGFKENRCIETPPRGAGGHYYMDYAAVAILKGDVMVFGGKSDVKKIAVLDGCSFNELPQRLQRGFQTETGSLVAFNEQNGSAQEKIQLKFFQPCFALLMIRITICARNTTP